MTASHVSPVSVVGSINIDYTTRVERLPAVGETVLGAQSAQSLGGKGANQAAAVAQLLGGCRMIGAVGDDAGGAWARSGLAAHGVDTGGVRVVPRSTTGAAFITVDAAGENTIVVSPAANAAVRVDPADVAGMVVVLSLEIGIHAALAAAEGTDELVVLNASPAQELPAALVARADVIVVNETEYERMPALAQARLVVRTEGARGSSLVREGRVAGRIPAHPVAQVVSSVGAGDAFCAGLTAALVSGMSIEDAAAAAGAVAADVLQQATAQSELAPLAVYAERARRRKAPAPHPAPPQTEKR